MKKHSLLNSFKFAFNGLRYLWLERNFRIHCLVALIVTCAAFYFNVTPSEWSILLLCMALVMVLEGVNTAIEILCDRFTSEIDPQIGKIKDISAAVVLLAAGFSAVIGMVIFLPRIMMLLGK